jgi:sialidase-1
MNVMMYKLHILILLAPVFSMCSVKYKTAPSPYSQSFFNQKHVPLFTGKENADVLEIGFEISAGEKVHELQSVVLYFNDHSKPDFLESATVKQVKAVGGETSVADYGSTSNIGEGNIRIEGFAEITPGSHAFHVSFKVKEMALLTESFTIEEVELQFKNGLRTALTPNSRFTYRPVQVLRAAGQDHCDTYRIPGLVTTGNGTLIAVYDLRYNNSKDLQEDIDVGMSRSTDGGQTWEPMKVIMDMGEWGGRPERLNGIGDPSVLYDRTTHTIWVAGLWMSGATENDMLWWASKPGTEPDETGQFILVKSTDDGVSWSEPVNITSQIKDPSWQLLLQGPGRGITLADGTLVFPAQFKADIGIMALDGGQYTSHATIIYSSNAGETWKIGTGARPNTTEAQVVQLDDGTLMLNMRDDLNRTVKDENNGRAVAVTSDLGKTWNVHPSSNSVLSEPNCMASIIATDIEAGSGKQQVLFFSNPSHKEARTNMTIKASLNGGYTWPETFWIELNESSGFGYSCMTMVDENTIGILYEGVKDLYFQKIPIAEFFQKTP